jgi:hypothetical protein
MVNSLELTCTGLLTTIKSHRRIQLVRTDVTKFVYQFD